MTTEHIIKRAKSHFDNMTRGTRDSETGDGKIWQVVEHTTGNGTNRDDHPTVKLSRAAHTDPDGDVMLPDDWRYEYMVSALQIIADAEPDQDLDELEYEIEGEIYNTNLTLWLGSHSYRAAYTDQACEEIDGGHDTFTRLTLGNVYEQQFVYQSVLAHIRQECEDAGVYA